MADITGGNAVSASTIRRWALEVIHLLAARAPRLDRILEKIATQGGKAVFIDGTLVHNRTVCRAPYGVTRQACHLVAPNSTTQ
ncbi:hypothetical protein [Nonomuraea sp. NPDC049400]|uniref:hypothetical protein n=1 Tax=Nonomuraea sp. NPDC049400 TaxID=3364352 RepID=UPI0037981315